MLFCDECGGLKSPRTVRGQLTSHCPRCDGTNEKPAPWWKSQSKGPARNVASDAARAAMRALGSHQAHARESKRPPAAAPPKPKRGPPPAPARIELPEGADLFPYSEVREGQREFLADVAEATARGKHLVANAPTGLGKTVSSLAPLVEHALRGKKRVFFLTSKQSQHKIAVETLRAIQKKVQEGSGGRIVVADVIGKQDMCPRREARDMFGKRFSEFCRREQITKQCRYWANTMDTGNAEGLKLLRGRIHHVEETIIEGAELELCPHQLAIDAAAEAHVVVCDYNYFFSDMREGVAERLRVNPADVILVVDEAHNLPDRIRDHLSLSLNDYLVEEAATELKDMGDKRLARIVEGFRELLPDLVEPPATLKAHEDATAKKDFRGRDGERFVDRQEFIDLVNEHLGKKKERLTFADYETILTELDEAAEAYEAEYREKPRGIATFQAFLANWKIERRGLARIYTRDPLPTLHYKILDASVLSRSVFESVHASVLMSGTLHPPEMYRDLLGLAPERTVARAYPSPFPPENRLLLVDNSVTTAYQDRSPEMYGRIAENLAAVADAAPGNVAAFFPSYQILEEVRHRLPDFLAKQMVVESREAGKDEKESLIGELRRGDGALLLGVQGGSLSEGYDYEDNLLKAVAIVGLPFAAPSLDVQALIDYYDKKFPGKGRAYAYVHPTLNRVLQAAGRCIRSAEDRGVIVLMDKRFNWSSYRATYPPGFDPRVSNDLKRDVRRFW